jgi:membrane-associated two-gene conflict system component 1 (EACC1)
MQVDVTSDDGVSLVSLADWFEADGVPGDVRMSAGPDRGAQNPLDVINIVISNSAAIAGVLLSYASWHKAKAPTPSPTVTFKVGEVEAIITNPDDKSIRDTLQALQR